MLRRFLRSEIGMVWFQYLAASAAMTPIALLYFELSSKLGEGRAFWLSSAIAVIVGLSVSACVGYLLRPRSAKTFLASDIKQISQRGHDLLARREGWAGVPVSFSDPYPLSNVAVGAMAAAHSSLG